MLGQMMHRDLSIIEILKFAAENHSVSEVVSLRTEGDVHRYTYSDCLVRVSKLANAILNLGVKKGDRVATLAWNGLNQKMVGMVILDLFITSCIKTILKIMNHLKIVNTTCVDRQ